jgi:MFS transporter, DHA1 family, solute carrier family 18 (vesicular amine transporter), member 1/2
MRVVVAAVIFEAALYSAVTPLLASYTKTIDLGTTGAGVLTAAYPCGMIIGSVAGARLVNTVRPRDPVLFGLALLAPASLIFGAATVLWLLEASRLLQGVGAGCAWAGMLAWIILTTPDESRGRALGLVLGAATFGTIFGPMLGTAAVALGSVLVFGTVALGALVLAFAVVTVAGPDRVSVMSPWSAVRNRTVLSVLGLTVMPGLTFGLATALIPMRLASAGASPVSIGLTFAVASLIASVVSPFPGRRADRHGAVALILSGSVLSSVLLVGAGVLKAAPAVVAATVLLLGLGVPLVAPAGLTLLTRSGEIEGLSAGVTAALVNFSLSGGEMLGAGLGARAAAATSDVVPFAALAVLSFIVAIGLALAPDQLTGVSAP